MPRADQRWLTPKCVAAWMAVFAGCSTGYEPPATRACVSNGDCEVGEICAVDQGICYPADNFPLGHLAFDIQESPVPGSSEAPFRVELRGCDKETVVPAPNGEIRVRKQGMNRRLALSIFDRNASLPDVSEKLSAAVVVSEASRLGLVPQRRTLAYASTEDVLTWDWSYHRVDSAPSVDERTQFLVVQSDPEGDRAPKIDLLTTALTASPCVIEGSTEECCAEGCASDVQLQCISIVEGELACARAPNQRSDFSTAHTRQCSRELRGVVHTVLPNMTGGAAVENAGVSIKYADLDTPFAVAAMGPELAQLQCATDDECAPDLHCDLSRGQCALRLAGRNAIEVPAITDALGIFSASVYNYCEGSEAKEFLRAFVATVVPEAAPLPTVNYRLVQRFLPPPVRRGAEVLQDEIEGRLCVPDWGGPTSTLIEFSGRPRLLLDGPVGEWTCCDTSCLQFDPTSVPTPPTPPERCGGAPASNAGATVQVAFAAPDPATWQQIGCLPTQADAFGNAGYLTRAATECATAGACSFDALPSGTETFMPRYDIRFESKVGSTLASRIFSQVEFVAGEPLKLELPRRRLLRGSVVVPEAICATPDDCGASDAFVVAERLRMAGESNANVPGPYFHTATTFIDPNTGRHGRYVMPLDAGVYLVTALPGTRTPGGPASIRIVDLREASTSEDFELDLGVLVTVALRTECEDPSNCFAERSSVLPLDMGSWHDLQHPDGGNLDLNASSTCFSSNQDGPRGCRIRQLTVGGTRLLLNVLDRVQFTARLPAKGDPTASCPG